jgi:hypothetical protein
VAFRLLASLTTRADLSVSFADEAICPVDVIWLPPAVLPYVGRDPTSLQVEFESDQIDMPEPHVLILTGGVSVTQGAQSIYAENKVFDKNLFTLETGEAVVQTHEGDRLVVDSLELQLETRIGRVSSCSSKESTTSRSPSWVCTTASPVSRVNKFLSKTLFSA